MTTTQHILGKPSHQLQKKHLRNVQKIFLPLRYFFFLLFAHFNRIIWQLYTNLGRVTMYLESFIFQYLFTFMFQISDFSKTMLFFYSALNQWMFQNILDHLFHNLLVPFSQIQIIKMYFLHKRKLFKWCFFFK